MKRYFALLLLLTWLCLQSRAVYPVVYQKTTFLLDEPRIVVATTSVGDVVLFVGGLREVGGASDVVNVFNTSSRQWSTSKLGQPTRFDYATSMGQHALFAIGSNGNSTIDIYDTSSGQWSTQHPLCTEMSSISASTTVGNYILYWGIADNATAICRFDPASLQWTIDPFRPNTRISSPAATTVGKYALFVGGVLDPINSTTVPSNLAFIFDSETLQWSNATLSQARYSMAATSAGDFAFFGGGIAPTMYSDTVDIFDSKTKTWSVNYLSRPKIYVTATSVGPYAIFGGGVTKGNPSSIDDVDIFDTTTNLWTYARLANVRFLMTATSAGRFALFATGYVNSIASSTIDIFEFPELSTEPTSNNNTPSSPVGVPAPTSSTSNSNVPVAHAAPTAATSAGVLYNWVLSVVVVGLFLLA